MAWIELVFVAVGMGYFALCRQKTSFGAVFCYLCLFILLREPGAGDMFFSHALAPFHIVLAWAAKVWCLCLGTSFVLTGERPSSWKIQLGLWLYGGSIATGMVWAFDAPNWGALWQWDGIETLSLCAFMSLYGLKTGRNERLSGYLCLFMVVVQNIALYGTGLMGDISRHSYASVSPNALMMMLSQSLWFVGVCVGGKIFRAKQAARLEKVNLCDAEAEMGMISTSIRRCFYFVIAGVAVSVLFGLLPSSTTNRVMMSVYYIGFIAIWCGLSNWKEHKTRVIAICGVITLGIPGMFRDDAEVELAEIRRADSRAELIGITAEKVEERVHYMAEIRFDKTYVDVEMDGYGGRYYPTGYRDIWSGGWLRIWGVDYRANRGVSLFIRDITLERIYEMWLLLWLILSISIFIVEKRSHRILKNSEDGCSGNKNPGIGVRET